MSERLDKSEVKKNLAETKIDKILQERMNQLVLKRLFDIVVSFIGLVFLLPIFLIISIIIKLDSKGPIFFRQVRIGKEGRRFKIYKFRTMIVDAEAKGMQLTVDGDNRITRSGHFLRKYKIDELPQLINVLIGDMGFVGPRPEVPKYVAMYNEKQKEILKIRPGITDIASIRYRDENAILAQSRDPEQTYINEIMPDKLRLNFKYIENMSVIYDIRLIFETVLKIVK